MDLAERLMHVLSVVRDGGHPPCPPDGTTGSR